MLICSLKWYISKYSDNFIDPKEGHSFAAYPVHAHTSNIEYDTCQKAHVNKQAEVGGSLRWRCIHILWCSWQVYRNTNKSSVEWKKRSTWTVSYRFIWLLPWLWMDNVVRYVSFMITNGNLQYISIDLCTVMFILYVYNSHFKTMWFSVSTSS